MYSFQVGREELFTLSSPSFKFITVITKSSDIVCNVFFQGNLGGSLRVIMGYVSSFLLVIFLIRGKPIAMHIFYCYGKISIVLLFK